MLHEWLVETYGYEDGWLYLRSTGKVKGRFSERYVRIIIRGKEYYMHRIIWFYHYAVWPDQIDHIDGNCHNNKIENLRECTMSQNIANASFGENRGVELHGAKYRARIVVNGNRIELGSYDTIEEARAAYKDAADRFFGEFAEANRQ